MRKLLVTAALSVATLVGTAGIASAEGPNSGTPRKVDCTKATARVRAIDQQLAKATTKLDQAQAKVDELKAAGRTKAADRLAGRVTQAKTRVSQAEAKLATAKTKLATACPAS